MISNEAFGANFAARKMKDYDVREKAAEEKRQQESLVHQLRAACALHGYRIEDQPGGYVKIFELNGDAVMGSAHSLALDLLSEKPA